MPAPPSRCHIVYALDAASRQAILARFPPKYPDISADHITWAAHVDCNSPLPSTPDRITVTGYVDDGQGVEVLVVAVNGSRQRPSDGGTFHITLSVDKARGRRPVESNDVIREQKIQETEPLSLNATPVAWHA